MAKAKKQVSKTTKKHSTKYSKLAAVCSKELAAKKAALVRAEKLLSKAQKTHTELLSEVARLDMLDRSLKALINGTEPPQNVRYVYTYPQWLWYPYNGWYWQGNTVTLGNPQTYVYNGGNFQGGQFTTNTVTYPATSVTTSLANAGSLTLSNCNSGGLTMDCSSSGINLTSSGAIPSGYSAPSTYLSTGDSAPQWQTVTTTSPNPDLTVDLSTGQVDPEAVVETEKVEPTVAEVGYGG